ncbi:MAG TPA: hypothetical protein VGI40_19645 [Pirellulaceae bacterium]|jgi:hypothetical protein
MSPENTEVKTYRIPRQFLFLGVFCTSEFAAFGVASTIAAYWNLDGSFKHPTRDAITFAVVWSSFSLLGVWLIVFYFRYRLRVSDEEIVQTGVLFTRAIKLAQVTAVKWRIIWRDVVLQAGNSRLRIGLEDVSADDREEFIAFLRRRFDASVHQAWPLFEKHLWGRSRRPQEPMSWRRLSLGLFLACLGTFAWFYLFVWLADGDRNNLNLGIVLTIILLICLSLPATRRELRRTKNTPAVEQ